MLYSGVTLEAVPGIGLLLRGDAVLNALTRRCLVNCHKGGAALRTTTDIGQSLRTNDIVHRRHLLDLVVIQAGLRARRFRFCLRYCGCLVASLLGRLFAAGDSLLPSRRVGNASVGIDFPPETRREDAEFLVFLTFFLEVGSSLLFPVGLLPRQPFPLLLILALILEMGGALGCLRICQV